MIQLINTDTPLLVVASNQSDIHLSPNQSKKATDGHIQLIQQLNSLLLSTSPTFSNVLSTLITYNQTLLPYNAFDYVIENQRGMKMFGIPLFSNNSLLPIDPKRYQLVSGKSLSLSENKLENFLLPDLGWRWSWDVWYILMYNDVDDEGWVYSHFFFNKGLSSGMWKGKYYFGNFVRRRIWMRMRTRTNVAS